MASRERSKSKPTLRPATTVEEDERQMQALASNLAKKQLLDGTASAQVITHFLKSGSARERLEQTKLQQENELMKAKIEQMASQARVEEMYKEALNAMRSYAGQDDDEEEYYD